MPRGFGEFCYKTVVRIPLSSIVLLATLAPGCAQHGPVHTAPDESRPHVSWEIRAGGDDGDAQSICGSAQPSLACVLTRSTVPPQTRVTVHLLLHAAAAVTTCRGTIGAFFISGAEGNAKHTVDATVPVGSTPIGDTINGIVTDSPAASRFEIRLDATQPGQPPVKISQDIPVIIK